MPRKSESSTFRDPRTPDEPLPHAERCPEMRDGRFALLRCHLRLHHFGPCDFVVLGVAEDRTRGDYGKGGEKFFAAEKLRLALRRNRPERGRKEEK